MFGNCTMPKLQNNLGLESASIATRNQLSMASDYQNEKQLPKSLADNLVREVFSTIEKHERGRASGSSSQCGEKPFKKIVADYDVDMDPRLKNWCNTLRCRKRLQERIAQRTGKRTEDVLFNRHATIDEQTKRMIICLMDTAVRHGGRPPNKETSMLKGRVDPTLCREIPELRVTEPKLRTFEFVGLPEISQMELASTVNPPESQWQRSEVLGNRISHDKDQIKEVLEHCPDIDLLQVATPAISEKYPVKKCQILAEDVLVKISSDTAEDTTTAREETKEDEIRPPSPVPVVDCNQIKINGTVYGFGIKDGLLTGDIQIEFQCDPLQRVRKTAINLENVGNRIIHVRWQPCNQQTKTLQQHRIFSNDFLFDMQPFVLLPGETRQIDVMYQPMWVGLTRQRWCMNMLRSSFCGTRRVYLSLHGVCTVPVSYRDQLERNQRVIVDKQKCNLASRLTKMHAELSTIIERSTLKCPYERPLDEREVFCILNPGYKCERYADVDMLKELYHVVKKPRHPPWDYSLETLRQCIYQHDIDQREYLHAALAEMLEQMRCNTNQVVDQLHFSQQQERSCFLYVRGLICTTIEDWETMSDVLGQQFFRSEMQRYLSTVNAQDKSLPKDINYIEWQTSQKVLTNKYFKDALYINTYTLVCDAAENIVSAIESTKRI